MRRTWASALAAMLLLMPTMAVLADAAFPDKPVRIEAGSTPGGGIDTVARILGEKMGTLTGQAFIIENKPGAANTIAADFTVKAPADGYTLLVANTSGQVIAPNLLKLSHDPLKQLTPIGLAVTVPHVIVVNADGPYKTFADLFAAVKAKPDGIRYATSGIGSVQHMATELFMAATGTQMTHIPYKGSTQAQQDILGGQVEVMFDTTSSSINLIKGGKLRALAVTTAKRSSELPDVPTLAELGVKNAEMSTWYALFAPAQTPAPVLKQLVSTFDTAMRAPEVQTRLKALAGEPGGMTREQFIALQATENTRFIALIKDRNIRMD